MNGVHLEIEEDWDYLEWESESESPVVVYNKSIENSGKKKK
jgi:hypothetical protein